LEDRGLLGGMAVNVPLGYFLSTVLQVLVEHQFPDVRPDLELDFVLPQQPIM
jgi:hypothetical protein